MVRGKTREDLDDRGRGKGRGRGVTKHMILILLMKAPEGLTESDIRDKLKDKHGRQRKEGVRRHLGDLQREGLLELISSPGKLNVWKIKEGTIVFDKYKFVRLPYISNVVDVDGIVKKLKESDVHVDHLEDDIANIIIEYLVFKVDEKVALGLKKDIKKYLEEFAIERAVGLMEGCGKGTDFEDAMIYLLEDDSELEELIESAIKTILTKAYQKAEKLQL